MERLSHYSSKNVKICEIGIANPLARFSQKEITDYIGITNPKLKKFFEHDHIQYRHIYLPSGKNFATLIGREKYSDLLERFISGSLDVVQRALNDCLYQAKIKKEEIDFICCVTSTGFIVPSLSARFIKHFGFRENCQRVDIVGMGCSAGLNGLNTVSNWCNSNPNKNALLMCVEICSAIYSIDNTPRTAVVNSLFGDGAAVALLRNDQHIFTNQPKVTDFESHLIPEYSDELRFDWDEEKNCYNFYVGKNTPQLISAAADLPLERLLQRNGLTKNNIKHWILHGGGNAVLLGIQEKLKLSEHDLRHTFSVLKEFGNLSSGSFLFSFKRLIEEESARREDIGLMITMGPGLTLEMALLTW